MVYECSRSRVTGLGTLGTDLQRMDADDVCLNNVQSAFVDEKS